MPESSANELASRLAEYPKEATTFFRNGIDIAAKLSEVARAASLKAVIQRLDTGTRRLDGAVLRPATGLGEREAEHLASAYSLMIGLLSVTDATADDFASVGQGTLFDPSQETIVRTLAQAIIQEKPAIRRIIDRTQLAAEVLPSLYSFNVTVDLRVRFSEGKVKTSVPVAVLHVDTDARKEIWLQLTRGEIADIVSKLTQCQKDMEAAEDLLKGVA